MIYTQAIVDQAILNARIAMDKAITDYLEYYGNREDRGSCGSAVVVGLPGTKRKLKGFIESAGVLGTNWGSYHKWGVNIRPLNETFQNQDHNLKEDMARAAAKSLSEDLDLTFGIYSWMD